jgi:hypothetical protein
MGLGESARTEDKKARGKNATFGVFERLYQEAYKEPNFAEKQWETTVKSKVIGPQWRPSDGGSRARPEAARLVSHATRASTVHSGRQRPSRRSLQWAAERPSQLRYWRTANRSERIEQAWVSPEAPAVCRRVGSSSRDRKHTDDARW